jgi:hypothetical protein
VASAELTSAVAVLEPVKEQPSDPEPEPISFAALQLCWLEISVVHQFRTYAGTLYVVVEGDDTATSKKTN